MTVLDAIARAGEAHRQALRAEPDPYRLLSRLAFDKRWAPSLADGVATVMSFYAHALGMISAYPEADRDALTRVAARLFGVRVRIVRRDLARAIAARAEGSV